MVSRCCLLLWLLEVKLAMWVLETPAGSVLPQYHHFQLILAHFTVYKVLVNLGNFGSDAPKTVQLYTNSPWLYAIGDWQIIPPATGSVPRCLTYSRWDEVEQKLKIYGIPEALKQSQSYPKPFGEALATLFYNNRSFWKRRNADIRAARDTATTHPCGCVDGCPDFRAIIMTPLRSRECWAEANLGGVAHLAVQAARASGNAFLDPGPELINIDAE